MVAQNWMSRPFWCAGPLQHPTSWRFCGLVIQTQQRTLQNTYKEVFITQPKIRWVREGGKRKAIVSIFFKWTAAMAQLVDKEGHMLRAPLSLALSGFYIIVLQICSWDIDVQDSFKVVISKDGSIWSCLWGAPAAFTVVLPEAALPSVPTEGSPPWETLKEFEWISIS